MRLLFGNQRICFAHLCLTLISILFMKLLMKLFIIKLKFNIVLIGHFWIRSIDLILRNN